VLGEPIGWNLIAGLGLVALGVALVQGVLRIPGARRQAASPPLVAKRDAPSAGGD